MENTLINEIDVRVIEPINKHRRIFARFDELNELDTLLIINDHDPKPLYYQLIAERGNIFQWEYELSGPEVWKVLIKKRALDNTETIADMAAKDIRKVEVFKKYGIDFCCGGKKSLEEVCLEKGIEIKSIREELESGTNKAETVLNFDEFKLDFLSDYIVNVHHLYVKKTIPFLTELSEKVSTKHSQKNPELLKINQLVLLITRELLLHMQKEEQVVFPYIKKLVNNETDVHNSLLKEPIQLMEMEHESVGAMMKEIELLSNKFFAPENACNSYRLLYSILKEFFDDLTLHIHLENNILFPKALDLLK